MESSNVRVEAILKKEEQGTADAEVYRSGKYSYPVEAVRRTAGVWLN